MSFGKELNYLKGLATEPLGELTHYQTTQF